MNGTQLKALTESILDGLSIDQDFFLQLANVAITNLQAERVWQYLKKLDASQSASSGNGYATAKTLPTDFDLDYKVLVGTSSNEYFPVAFEEQVAYRNSSNRYYIDIGAGTYYLLGNSNGGTIQFFYKRTTTPITLTTSPVFPDRFHPLIAFFVAGYYQMGVDADDIFARMSPENKAQAVSLHASMIQWDTDLKARAQNNRVGVADSEPGVSLEQM